MMPREVSGLRLRRAESVVQRIFPGGEGRSRSAIQQSSFLAQPLNGTLTETKKTGIPQSGTRNTKYANLLTE